MPDKQTMPAEAERIEADAIRPLLSIAKSIRQLVAIKLAEVDVAVGQDQFLLSFTDEGAVSVFGMASRLSVRPSTVSKMADILQRKGWVERSADTTDARRVLVRLTPAGRRVREAVDAITAKLDAELMDALGGDRQIVAMLATIDAVLAKRLRRLR